MSQSQMLFAIVPLFVFTPAILADAEPDRGAGRMASKIDQKVTSPVVWKIDNLDQIGGLKPIVLGSPHQIVTERGPALTFNGSGDGLFVPTHPLHGAKQFTVEIIFRPAVGGAAEQRFFHMQENGSENRVMFETRLVGDDKWFLDTFIRSGDKLSDDRESDDRESDDREFILFAEEYLHRLGPWYHVALVVDGKQMRHYVNGKLEMSTPIDYTPQGPGKTSIGMRINKVFWYQGDIREARFSQRALSADEFHLPHDMIRVP